MGTATMLLLTTSVLLVAVSCWAHPPTTLDEPSASEVGQFIVGGSYVRDKYKWPSMCSLAEGDWHYTSSLLKEAKLDILTYPECQDLWGKSALKSHVCAKDLEKSDKGACNGDSGGPLYCRKSAYEPFNQVGVFSWMAGNCDPYWPAMYASVAHYREWIREHAEGL